jgi:exonuclease SbcD
MPKTRPIRIAHLADSHLGYSALTRLCPDSGRNQRTVDVEHAFETAIDQIIAAGDIDLVLHAGDVFHHSRPPMPSLIFFLKQLRKLDAAGIPMVVIGGNHDTPRLRNAGSVFDVCALVSNTAYFACGYDWTRFRFTLHGQPVVVTAIPHGAYTNDTPPDAIPTDDGALNILVTHGVYNIELLTKRGGADEIAESLVDPRYAYIALGHWHIHEQKAENAWYSGSSERIGLSDLAAKPGYARVTLNGSGRAEVEHVPLPARAIEQLPHLDAESLDADAVVAQALKRIDRLSEAERAQSMVLLRVTNAALGVARDVERMLRAHETVKACWAFIPDIRSVRAPGSHIEETSPIGQLVDEFAAFVEGRRAQDVYTAEFAAEFRETGTELLREAIKASHENALTLGDAPAATENAA